MGKFRGFETYMLGRVKYKKLATGRISNENVRWACTCVSETIECPWGINVLEHHQIWLYPIKSRIDQSLSLRYFNIRRCLEKRSNQRKWRSSHEVRGK